ncbi:MAG: cyclic pyranopterin monophosphate synthase MoaC [Gammaproteobacteria bacterium]|jgi:cyclic pyranopterin monophosphate synthase|nr:cyclic pyranopterin monophosphate synthase MoaC [Gammaproteobacteria bacterium]MBT4462502.1 cyclic pyranopterin monophosphate synthase MoaC [Gammaproteobacteria bacterium]MBT4654749.1 cyclic pyranopterin monophosphate synthase MoaC [Gammaproteobacteria bacterium]MBT5116534.1 cyclic pyranopterin monophosphate synthase MoaC [Gammaproteobacteria bacterium]MBT5761622.1 cyclic pyranopterin monophosphate synthase MoaC [Gammaproteobacteria bacterium]
MKKSNHIDNQGNVRMINVIDKKITKRKAVATGKITLNKLAIDSIKHNRNKKGDVLTIAQVAGIQAAKKTSTLVPLSHQLNIKGINIFFKLNIKSIICNTEILCDGKTGVEIEAICATQISLLTIYDMCKYLDKSMVISDIKLLLKEGGKSGDFKSK